MTPILFVHFKVICWAVGYKVQVKRFSLHCIWCFLNFVELLLIMQENFAKEKHFANKAYEQLKKLAFYGWPGCWKTICKFELSWSKNICTRTLKKMLLSWVCYSIKLIAGWSKLLRAELSTQTNTWTCTHRIHVLRYVLHLSNMCSSDENCIQLFTSSKCTKLWTIWSKCTKLWTIWTKCIKLRTELFTICTVGSISIRLCTIW